MRFVAGGALDSGICKGMYVVCMVEEIEIMNPEKCS